MPRVIIVQVVFNNRPWIEPVFSAIFEQTFRDFKVVVVIAGNSDGSKELIASKFPHVEIIDPGYNIGFAKGHNLVFDKYQNTEFFQLVNPDLVLEPNYVEEMLKVFEDEKVGVATGKLYKIGNHESGIINQANKILDTTGVTINKSGRARDRGQYEVDTGQFDEMIDVQAVSGAGAMYRRKALEAIKLFKSEIQSASWRTKSEINFNDKNSNFQTKYEFFDEDFHSYWEDVDLSWRMANKGWKNVFVRKAIGFHGRTAGSSKNGYGDVTGFIKHHRALPERIRQLNYKNHIFMYIKNSRWFYPQFFIREFFMLIYILLFEISTLRILPKFLNQLPRIWKKRKLIYP